VALKVRALVAAGRLRDPRTVGDLIKLLGAKEVEVREAAAWALSLLRHRRAKRALRKALQDPKVGVEIFACVGLGLQARPPVEQMMEAAEDRRRRPEVRAACAFGLGLTRSPRVMPLLLRLLSEEREVIVRKAAWALGMLGHRDAVEPLSRRVWERSGRVQRALAWALSRAVAGGAYTPGHDARVRLVQGRVDWAAHLEELQPVRPTVNARDAERMLARAGSTLASGLERALGRHRDLVLRILQGLDGHPREVRVPMLGLETWPKEGGSDRLRAALEPLRAALRRSVKRLMTHRDPDVRMHALRIAAKVDSPRTVSLIRKGLADRSALVRRAAGKAAVIAASRQPARRAALVRLLQKDLRGQPWHEQLDRLRRLGELGASQALPTLRRFAKHKHGFLAEAAVRALGRIGDRKALPTVRAALRYPAALVRIAAVRALAQLAGGGAAPALKRLAAEDPSVKVRRTAAAALKKLR
jgi:HEAT repeat protein